MKRLPLFGLLALALSAPASAESWIEVARLPNGTVVTLDVDGLDAEGMDRIAVRSTWSKWINLPGAMKEMRVHTEFDCANETTGIIGFVQVPADGSPEQASEAPEVTHQPVRDNTVELQLFLAACRSYDIGF